MRRKVISRTEKSNIATVYIASINEKKVEFVQSVQPPFTRREKWVMIISTMFGCPVGCSFCDAGGDFSGLLSKDDLFFQTDYLVGKYSDKRIADTKRLKIQFARMGEPALNDAVLDMLRELPARYEITGMLMPSLSTIAPAGREKFFNDLLKIKSDLYAETFQLQFSIHSSDAKQRDELIPVKKWTFSQISEYGEKFFSGMGRKITLNFAVSPKIKVDPKVIADHFPKDLFLMKTTPVNPSFSALENGLESHDDKREKQLCDEFVSLGYDVIHSVGEREENLIGSNCGQYIQAGKGKASGAYSYRLIDL